MARSSNFQAGERAHLEWTTYLIAKRQLRPAKRAKSKQLLIGPNRKARQVLFSIFLFSCGIFGAGLTNCTSHQMEPIINPLPSTPAIKPSVQFDILACISQETLFKRPQV